MTVNIRILSNKVAAEDQDRAEAAAAAFTAKHSLTDAEVVAIYQDTDHPLFDELDSAITNAATQDWHNPNAFDGYEIWA